MPDALSGVVSSMAFTADGHEVWVAHPSSGVEVRSWPGFELQRVLPMFVFFLAAHPTDPYMAALSTDQAYLLDSQGAIIRSWQIKAGRLLAAAFLDDTLQLLFEGRHPTEALKAYFTLWSCPLSGGESTRLAEISWERSLWVFWAALLPTRRMVFLACNDHEPLLWRIADGTIKSARPWAPKPDGSAMAWLAVDVSSCERFVSWSMKNGQAFFATLHDFGEIEHCDDIWLQRERVASGAIHHRDQVAVYITVKGRMCALPLAEQRSGWPSFQFDAGYRWG